MRLQVTAGGNTFHARKQLKENDFIWDEVKKVWTADFVDYDNYNDFYNEFVSARIQKRKQAELNRKIIFSVREMKELHDIDSRDDAIEIEVREKNGTVAFDISNTISTSLLGYTVGDNMTSTIKISSDIYIYVYKKMGDAKHVFTRSVIDGKRLIEILTKSNYKVNPLTECKIINL